MNMDDRLFQYYLNLRSPEAGEWNSSPACLYTELSTRDYVRTAFEVKAGLQVCNVGIGTGDWDDYLGYWLNGKGCLTSIDIDRDLCELFAYRQKREGHPNPSRAVCESIFETSMSDGQFDLVTLIGSTAMESGDVHKCLDSCINLLKQDGALMFMSRLKNNAQGLLEQYIDHSGHQLERMQRYEAFPEYPFFICTIRK